MKCLLVLAFAVGAAAAASAQPAPLVQMKGDEPVLGAGWRLVTLPRQKPPVTRYSTEMLDGRAALRIDARASYGNVAQALAGPAPQTVRWSWRVDERNPGTDLRSKEGDDSPAKVCLSFDLPLERVPFFERGLLAVARARTNEALPAATLCWAWGGAAAIGSTLPNPYTQRVRYIVLRGQGDATGRWFDEVRDVATDFRAAFGEESDVVPPVTAVLVGGDADNTGAQTLAFVSALVFAPAIPAAGK